MSARTQYTRVLPSAAVAIGALVGCASSYGPPSLKPGASLADAVAALGQPTGRYPIAGGERVEYARGPFGKHTYMLDFDAQGRMVDWRQVLVEPEFNAIHAGMTREQVLQSLGHPSESRPLWLAQAPPWQPRAPC